MFRRSYEASPTLREGLFVLLDEAFPGIAAREVVARKRGVSWERCSTPFVVEECGEVIAHVGLLAMTLVVDGAERSVGGVHAVATRRDRRRRGHAQRLLEEAIAFGRERHEALVLIAGSPDLYRGVGFRVVREHRFICASPPPTGVDRGRWLEWDDAADREILGELLERRQPVSRRVGVVGEHDVFLFNTVSSRLRWFPELECIAWMSLRGHELVIHDLIGERVPSLPLLLASIGGPVDRVVAEFCPDGLGWPFEAHPHVYGGDELLMAHGPLFGGDTERAPIALPRSARC